MSSKSNRHAYIRGLLQKDGEVAVPDLSARLSVSETTIRKDLTELEKANLLVRTHGGARTFLQAERDPAPMADCKALVARKAAELVSDGEIVFLGSGTTCIQIAHYLKLSRQNLTVVSNNLNVLEELKDASGYTVLSTGGQLSYLDEFSVFHGDFVIQFLEKVLVQKAFLTADGISLKNGYTTHNRNEYHLYESIRKISEHMIFVVEGRKFNRNSILRLADMSSISTIVSDPSIPQEFVDYYRETNKKLYLSDPPSALRQQS